MSSRKAADTDPWAEAVCRSTVATAAARLGEMDENCWDDVAMRNIIAMVLYALHLRDQQSVASISWNAVLWQLRGDQRVNALVTGMLPGPATIALAPPRPGIRWPRRGAG
ncbi:hypothetical protein O1L55_40685 [Streptomyces albulus]|nr:hypothetical protein [Streptomyces noursei]